MEIDFMEIKSGDAVRLKSGGPVMTCGYVSGNADLTVCHWFSGDALREGYFFPDQLELAIEEPEPN